MRKSTLLKIAMTLTAMFLISGVFAQINLTVKNSTGTNINGAIIYTKISSSPGTEAVIATDGGLGDLDATLNGVIRFNPTIGTNYIVKDAAVGTMWNTIAFSAAADATIYLNASFTNTKATDYVSGYEADKVTINQPMPYWVIPSPVHNPAWVAPAGPYATQAQIEQNVGPDNLQSTFAWTATGLAPVAAGTNYVEYTFATTGSKTITATETAAAAYGGCAASTVTFFVTAINPPFARINETFNTVLGVSDVIGNGCGTVNTNIDVLFDNASEEFPYHIVPTIIATNYDLNGAGTGLINPAVVTGSIPVALQITAADNTPISLAAAGELIASKGYTPINNKITVYEINLAKWNAKVSRKSDYVALRAGSLDNTRPDSYKYYTAATSGQPALDKTIARIIVMPTPVTGPIYHIANSWGL